MKTLLILTSILFGSVSFAQDMSSSENSELAYRTLSDGSTVYVGRCLTHEDYQGKAFVVAEVIQSRLDSSEFTLENVKKIYQMVGGSAFRLMMKNFFGNLVDLSTTTSVLHDFMEYADDITIERIRFFGKGEYDMIRFNVGYGGGNGGYLVLLPKKSNFEKISLTFDGNLEYCDSKVWK